MKKLDTSAYSLTNGFPAKKGTWDFLQLAYQEGFSSIIQGLIGPSYSPTTLYNLWGCVATGMHGFGLTAPTSITAGAVYYGGEVFLVDATSFVWGAGLGLGFDVAISTTQYTTNADPVRLTSSTTQSIHDIRKVVFSGQFSPTPPPNGIGVEILPTPIPLLNYAAAPLFGALSLSAVGGSTGSLSYYVNPITNTLQLKGSINVIGPSLGATGGFTGPLYYQMGVLPSYCTPTAGSPFSCFRRYHEAAILDDTGLDHIITINAEVDTSAGVNFGLIKSSSNYTLYFNTLIPLS